MFMVYDSFQHLSDYLMEEDGDVLNVVYLTLTNVTKALTTTMQLQLLKVVKYMIYLSYRPTNFILI